MFESAGLRCIELAEEAMKRGDHPFGAVLVVDERIVLEARNAVHTSRDPSAHAEMELVRQAGRLSAEERAKATLVTSTEPCAMCSGAIYWAGIGAVAYCCPESRLAEVAGSDFLIPCREIFAHGVRPVLISGPMLEEQAAAQHARFWPAYLNPSGHSNPPKGEDEDGTDDSHAESMMDKVSKAGNLRQGSFYEELLAAAEASVHGEPDLVSNLANLASLLYWELREKAQKPINWCGFYVVRGRIGRPEEEELVLGPFHGHVACLRIRRGRGVCGAAWRDATTVRVPDVHAFPGHIACDSASRSEIVVPVVVPASGRVVAVLDLDASDPNVFTEEDQRGLERIVQECVSQLNW